MHGSNHLILGSTSLQLVDGDNPEKRRTVADDTQEDENLLDPPLHLARFGPKGTLVTASVENCLVKVWPPIDENTGMYSIIICDRCLYLAPRHTCGLGVFFLSCVAALLS